MTVCERQKSRIPESGGRVCTKVVECAVMHEEEPEWKSEGWGDNEI